MRTKKLILLFVISCSFLNLALAQQIENQEVADKHSLQLYNEGNWTALLQFGRKSIKSGTDFSILKMRTAYAAFMLKNYSQSLKLYEAVYNEEPNNNTALYYCYLNNLYLNNKASARYYASKLDLEIQIREKQHSLKFSEIELEYSYKNASIPKRGDAQYAMFNFKTQLGFKTEVQLGAAMYNQIINEPQFLYVTDSDKIDISQKEVFAKLIFTPIAKLNMIGGFHYLNIPFNNFKYNNTITFGGLKYTTPYVHIQGLAHFANITDRNHKQFDLTLSTYPLGNINLYTMSKGMFGENQIFTQVIGIKVIKNTWLEGNLTLGKYETLIDNDGLYLINDIDTKRFKTGASIYTLLSNKFLIGLNYNFEQKERYQVKNIFNQHSTTINLKWKL